MVGVGAKLVRLGSKRGPIQVRPSHAAGVYASPADEYALARANASQSGANHVLSTGCGGSRANASRKQSIGLCYTPGLLSSPDEVRRGFVPARKSLSSS